MAEFAKTQGVYCVMESLRDDESNIVNSLETAKKMYRDVGHPHLKMMVDSIATGAAGETLDDWFDAFGKDLIHMHFLDGDPYLHNVWGDGNTPLEAQLETMNHRGFTGYLVQEIADEKYFDNPFDADIRNMRVLERFIEE
jgi:protein FrlC